MKYQFHDGGRAEARFKGETRDCVVRAIAIVTGKPYKDVYDAINSLAKSERLRTRKRSSSRTGVFKETYKRYLESIGWKWVPTMAIGSGCKVHLRAAELPAGKLVVSLSRHLVAVIDGVVFDIRDPARGGTRCVYGYYTNNDGDENDANHNNRTGRVPDEAPVRVRRK